MVFLKSPPVPHPVCPDFLMLMLRMLCSVFAKYFCVHAQHGFNIFTRMLNFRVIFLAHTVLNILYVFTTNWLMYGPDKKVTVPMPYTYIDFDSV